ncbi:hypothetical protein CYY_004829 [Polysphondylium violaceum]|uniref:N-alpha-acetyltransferase 60 n=1 Tax=Polysphondylium violaceum TaxID=133409 RepID=A0A8J4PXH2_9MYCE|nr:hypothetical protein CYY_004829 [Polysphondylium violaceum]
MGDIYEFEFRSLTWNDIELLKQLQKDLFPVQYPDSFYRKLTLEDRFISILAWANRKNSQTTISTLIDNNGNSGGTVNNQSIGTSINNNTILPSYYSPPNVEIPPPTFVSSPPQSHTSSPTLTSRLNHQLTQLDSTKSFQQELIGVVTARIDIETGLCSLFFDSIQGYIMTFGVKQEYRKQGIGLKLLNNISEQLKKRKCNKITLHVKSINRDAYSFYIKNGFQVEETIENYYTIAKVQYNALKMYKHIENTNGNRNWNSWFKMLSLSDSNKDDDDDDDDYRPPPPSSTIDEEEILNNNNNNNDNLNYRYSNYYKSLLEENKHANK